jgi:hypothetical protein
LFFFFPENKLNYRQTKFYEKDNFPFRLIIPGGIDFPVLHKTIPGPNKQRNYTRANYQSGRFRE